MGGGGQPEPEAAEVVHGHGQENDATITESEAKVPITDREPTYKSAENKPGQRTKAKARQRCRAWIASIILQKKTLYGRNRQPSIPGQYGQLIWQKGRLSWRPRRFG